MRLELKNIGPLREASIDLAHDLIVFTGPNNTGKTFAAYSIYGWNKYFTLKGNRLPEVSVLTTLLEKKEITEKYFDLVQECLGKYELFMKQNLYDLFAQAKNTFSDESTSITLFLEKNDLEELTNGDFSYAKTLLNINFVISNNTAHYRVIDVNENLDKSWTNFSFYTSVFGNELEIWRSSYIFPVERVVLSSLHQSFKPENETTKDLVPRYTLPVRDHLQMLNDIINLSKNESPLVYLAEWLESEILKGKIIMSRYGELQYRGNGSKQAHSISVSASITKSLASLVFYFRHLAKEGDRIIIDEPELNLHPDNQRTIARFLVRVMNAGVKVLISTHSADLLRELNSLMMLGSKSEDKKAKKLMREYKYKSEDLLSYKRVGAYLFTGDSCEQLDVEETGFEVLTIDQAINDMNERSDDIYYTLFDA